MFFDTVNPEEISFDLFKILFDLKSSDGQYFSSLFI